MGRCVGIQSSVFLYALLPASVSGWWVGSEPRTTLSEGGGDFYLVRRCLRVHSSMYPYSLPHARGSIPEGPSVAVTQVGATRVWRRRSALFWPRTGPLKPAKYPACLSTAPTSPGSERTVWEHYSPRVGQSRDRICPRSTALGAGPRGRHSGNRVESLPRSASGLHLLQLRSARARPGGARGARLPAPFCRAGPRRGGALGAVLTGRRGGGCPGEVRMELRDCASAP